MAIEATGRTPQEVTPEACHSQESVLRSGAGTPRATGIVGGAFVGADVVQRGVGSAARLCQCHLAVTGDDDGPIPLLYAYCTIQTLPGGVVWARRRRAELRSNRK